MHVRTFPALFRAPAAQDTKERVVLPDQSTCFFHADRAASVVCAECGRFLCSLCTVQFEGQAVCPSCIGSGMKKQRFQHLDKGRIRYDRLALALAVLPLLLWPFTLVTAPLALGAVVYGARKPLGIVSASRWRFLVAAILAIIQVAVWTFVLINLATGGSR